MLSIMSEQFESIMRGLQQVAAYQNGDTSKCRVRKATLNDVEPIIELPKEKIVEFR